MSEVAILTNNLASSEKLVKKIEFLGHEVYCSSKLVGRIINSPLGKSPDMYSMFNTFIFSETLTDGQVQELLAKMPVDRINTLKEAYCEISKEDREMWQSKGISNWLGSDISIDGLRELIANSADDNAVSPFVKTNTIDYTINVFDFYKDIDEISGVLSLSLKEQAFFSTLLENKGKYITRNEMCQILWNKEPSASHLAQLSQIASKIRLKMKSKGFDDKNIVTNWNLGYSFIPYRYEKVDA